VVARSPIRSSGRCQRLRMRALQPLHGLMADLLAPATRAETERLIEKARAYRDHLAVTFDAACRRRSAEDGERARAVCGRLSDELGVTLVDLVRRKTVRDYGNYHGECPWCAARDGWFEQISGDTPQDE
jgi:hypothetical protein